MGMLMAILGGFLAVILGIIGLIFWFGQFIELLQGTIPLILILGGGIALFIGITEIKDTLKSKDEENRFETFQEESKTGQSGREEAEKESKGDDD